MRLRGAFGTAIYLKAAYRAAFFLIVNSAAQMLSGRNAKPFILHMIDELFLRKPCLISLYDSAKLKIFRKKIPCVWQGFFFVPARRTVLVVSRLRGA